MITPRIDDNRSVPCPVCGSHTLHQDTVEVFFRKEDAKSGIAVLVQGKATHDDDVDLVPVSVSTDQTGNPSPRRDGVAIQFWCEACPATPVLHVLQHKGDTIIEWAKT